MRLYRGITTTERDAEEIMHTIKTEGLKGTEGAWQFDVPDVQKTRERIKKENLLKHSVNDLENECVFRDDSSKGICAGGDYSVAEYYAREHNYSVKSEETCPIVIEFEAPVSQIYVDGRDFLYPAFQCHDRVKGSNLEKQKQILSNLFGENILQYFAAAASTDEQKQRIFLCDIACFDEGVVRDHANNKTRIHGRYNTRFRSAFFVQAPVVSAQIKKVTLLSSVQNNSAPLQGAYMDSDMFYNAGTMPDRL